MSRPFTSAERAKALGACAAGDAAKILVEFKLRGDLDDVASHLGGGTRAAVDAALRSAAAVSRSYSGAAGAVVSRVLASHGPAILRCEEPGHVAQLLQGLPPAAAAALLHEAARRGGAREVLPRLPPAALAALLMSSLAPLGSEVARAGLLSDLGPSAAGRALAQLAGPADRAAALASVAPVRRPVVVARMGLPDEEAAEELLRRAAAVDRERARGGRSTRQPGNGEAAPAASRPKTPLQGLLGRAWGLTDRSLTAAAVSADKPPKPPMASNRLKPPKPPSPTKAPSPAKVKRAAKQAAKQAAKEAAKQAAAESSAAAAAAEAARMAGEVAELAGLLKREDLSSDELRRMKV